jgi:O-antigen ligase
MTLEAPAAGGPAVPEEEADAEPGRRRPLERRAAAAALALLPGIGIAFFSFNGGGFFPGTVGFAALLVSQMIVLRVLVADDPFSGFSRPLAVVVGLMALYTGWTLASGLWADSSDRALTEFDRALLYTLLLLLMGLLPRRAARVMWIVRGCAVAAVAVCGAALITRVLPHVWHTSPGVANNRLSFPLTYWNALGLLAAIGLVLTVAITTSDRESKLGRVLGAAAVPVLATTMLFTFSRGAIGVTVVGLVAYILFARQRALVAGLLAVLPPTVIALVVAYGADELATANPTSAAGVAQGKDVALAVGVCIVVAAALRFALIPLDRRMSGIDFTPERHMRLRLGITAVTGLVVVVALAAGGGGWVSDQYHGFVRSNPVDDQADLRSRLTDPSANGRIDHWRAATDGFSSEPLRGTGAGTYQFTWDRYRRIPVTVVDAHGLYVETLSDLGIVGLVLLGAVILAILGTLLRRTRGLNRGYYAALFGAGLAWALHAGVDWDWEMPAVTAWFFAAGGAALAARRAPSDKPAEMANGNRITIAAAFLVMAITPALLMLSQSRLSDAAAAFQRNDCRAATASSLASLDYLSVRPEPYQMLGYCDLEQGRLTQGVAAMEKAVELEPRRWEYRYSLAVAQAEAGRDPRAAIAEAKRLNPREPLIDTAAASFAKSPPSAWPKAGETAGQAIITSGQLSLK